MARGGRIKRVFARLSGAHPIFHIDRIGFRDDHRDVENKLANIRTGRTTNGEFLTHRGGIRGSRCFVVECSRGRRDPYLL